MRVLIGGKIVIHVSETKSEPNLLTGRVELPALGAYGLHISYTNTHKPEGIPGFLKPSCVRFLFFQFWPIHIIHNMDVYYYIKSEGISELSKTYENYLFPIIALTGFYFTK